jgi:hypothetical protein
VLDLYLAVLDRALDPDVPLVERQAAGRFLHGLAADWQTGTQRGRGFRSGAMGDLIREALSHRIDGR